MTNTAKPRIDLKLIVTGLLLALLPPIIVGIEGGPVLLWSALGLALAVAYVSVIYFLIDLRRWRSVERRRHTSGSVRTRSSPGDQ